LGETKIGITSVGANNDSPLPFNRSIMSTSEIAILVAVILIYIGWALFNGFLAKQRNHSFWAWFGISLCILPPFAMIAVLVYCKEDNTHIIP